MPETKIRVGLVEDDAPTRDGLRWLIGSTDGFACVGAFGSVEAALAGLAAEPPDVLLLDIHLPGMLGSEAVPLLRQRFPRTQIVMLTVYAAEDKVFESLRSGACGYVLKKTPPLELMQAVRDAHAGGSPMSSEIARKVIDLLRRTPPAAADCELTPQESRLLKLLSEGYSYQGAAGQMNVSVNTVRNYVRSVYEKLQVNTRSEAVGKALRGGLIH
ncbi:MAG TPA: response regulator transcription factor [Vicinamibacteria bacterium]|nr:response regulator transcription factor [Vicinamibacteria bacterium]